GRGKSVQTPIYDFTTHSRFPQTQHTEARPIILVDGILIFHPETIVNMLDLKIFIETAEPVRFARRLRRDVTERGRTPEGVRDQYRLSVKPMHDLFVEPSKRLADQIISGEEPFTAKLHSLVKQ